MSSFKIAKVAVEHTAYSFDTEFSYTVPKQLENIITVGARVKVPFGAGNKKRQGLVMELAEEPEMAKQLKPISEILDTEALINDEMIQLAKFMKSRYFCTLFDAINAMIPTGIQYSSVDFYVLANDISPEVVEKLNDTEKGIINSLINSTTPVKKDKLLKDFELPKDSDILLRLEKRGIVVKSSDMIRKVGDANIRMLKLKVDVDAPLKLTKRQREVFDLLKTVGCASQKEIMYFTGVTSSVINGLLKRGIIELSLNEVYRIPYEEFETDENVGEIDLTDEQSKAYNNLISKYKKSIPEVSLLYGVTGSGKTSVFMKVIDEVVKDDKGVILMVPEIALTTQLVSQFKSRYKGKVAVFHSALSMGERLDEYKRVKNGDAKIAIGTRSAVFAPFSDLGLIVMDEEQEHTYKSETTPRFNALDIAKFRVNYHKSLLLLSSATPSIESYYYAQNGRYSLNAIEKRYGKAQLPEVEVVDMNEELLDGNKSIISEKLLEEMKTAISNNKQVILLLNRRGYHTFVRCKACKEIVTCPHCSIAMTYHSANNRLMCHYCGHSIEYTEKCPNCGEKALTYGGVGTQKIEDEIKALLPEARVLRVDADSTMTKFSHKEKFDAFKDKKYDIMIGTQMVAKGLDFDDVVLVGVLNADQSLYSDDFRSYERAFDLITQVVGRSGRREHKGKAIIQTYTPENNIINLAAAQDYKTFYEAEISIRKSMIYPPFCDICVLGFVGANQASTLDAANYFFKCLRQSAENVYKSLPLVVFPVSSANLIKISSKYRYRIVLKTKNNKDFRNMISDLLIEFSKNKKYSGISAFADINPYNIM